MDPKLADLLEVSGPQDEFGLIVRFRSADDEPPPGLRVVTRTGTVATCRASPGAARAARAAPQVVSVKAPWLYSAELVEVTDEQAEILPHDERRPANTTPTGAGVVLGVIDWGLDIACPDFITDDGRTRLLALWDQRPGHDPDHPNRYGYGRIHKRDTLNRALQSEDPYGALRYHPADADGGGGAHGTHTTSIAAGNGRGGGPCGLAPESEIVFVHLSTWGPQGPDDLGDSVALLEAVDFIASVAGERATVINLSLGRHGGPHDGRTLVEIGLDEFAQARPGRLCVHSAGNYFTRAAHTAGRLTPGRPEILEFILPTPPQPSAVLDLWYSGSDRITAELMDPDGVTHPLPHGTTTLRTHDGAALGIAHHRLHDPNNHRNELLIRITQRAPVGTWVLRLTDDDLVDGRFHAWLERAVRGQPQPTFTAADPKTTTGSICHSQHGLAVGATDHDGRLAPFSSSGPTSDGRAKPDLVAPGARVLAARSTPAGAPPGSGGLVRMSGTSMAAPHVAGTATLLLSSAEQPLGAVALRRLLLDSAVPLDTEDPDRAGTGLLNSSAALGVSTRTRPELPPVTKPDRPLQEDAMLIPPDGSEPQRETAEATAGIDTETEAVTWTDAGDAIELAEIANIGTDRDEVVAGEAVEDECEAVEDYQPTETDELTDDEAITDADGAADTVPPDALVEGEVEDSVESPPCDVAEATAGPDPEAALADAAVERDPATINAPVAALLHGSPESEPVPAQLYNHALAGTAPHQALDVVALPGRPPAVAPQPGDLMLRRVETGATYASVVGSPGMHPREDVIRAGRVPESGPNGWYVHVIEAGPRPHGASDGFARRLVDGTGHTAPMTVLLRPTAENIPDTELELPGGTAQDLQFMRAVYREHVSRAARGRRFIADVPVNELGDVDGVPMRRELVQPASNLMADARAAMAGTGITNIRIISGYRSATRQFRLWQQNFPRYMQETATARQALPGGPQGPQAVVFLARYISGRLAAPGYSLHNDGRALDLGHRHQGRDLGADTSTASRAAWRRSPLFDWLQNHAGRYGFALNPRIDEPWHWQFSDQQRYMGITDVAEVEGEAAEIAAGTTVIPTVPLIRTAHPHGRPPDLVLKWNTMHDPIQVDVVVHLHGWSSQGRSMRIDRHKLPFSGLDFTNPSDPADPAPGRTRPTLAVLPRGEWLSGPRYGFPLLSRPDGLRLLVEQALDLAAALWATRPQRGRLILTAHSGGGSAMLRALAHNQNDVDEVHVFDALYGNPAALTSWARARLTTALSNTSDAHAQLPAMRVLWTPLTDPHSGRDKGTRTNSEAVGRAIEPLLATAPEALHRRFRVERSHVQHNDVPRAYGWRLLANAGADLPRPGAQSREAESDDCAIDSYRYDYASECLGQIPPGTHAFIHQFLWPTFGRRPTGVLNCRTVRGGQRRSLHSEGRAIDYELNANRYSQAIVAKTLIHILLATDREGNAHALARRLGVQEIIWERRIWTAGRRAGEGMRPYRGVNPHTDHIHIGLNWLGARRETSYWRGCTQAGLLPAAPTARPPGSVSVPQEPQPEPGRSPAGTAGRHDNQPYVVYADRVRVGGSRAWRNNNPGNIVAGRFTRGHGAIGSDGRFAIFPDEATGTAAVAALLRTERYRDLTIAEAITRYAPPHENDTAAYIATIRRLTGLDTNRRIKSLNDTELDAVVRAIRRIEGWRQGTDYTCDANPPDWVRRLLNCGFTDTSR